MLKTFTILLLSLLCTFSALLGAENALRVVSLAPALTETVVYLAGPQVLVGRSDVCNYPESIRKVPVVGKFGMPELEKVLAQKPDWVIANTLINPAAVPVLKAAHAEVTLQQCRNLEDYLQWVKIIGQKLHCVRQAEWETERIQAFQAEIKVLKPLPLKVLWVIWDAPLMVAGPGSLPDEVLRMTGAENAAKNAPSEYFKCSAEWLLSADVDVIVWDIPHRFDARKRLWKMLPAVQNHQVLSDLDDDTLLRPGPRWPDGLREFRKKLEAFRPLPRRGSKK